MDQSNRSIHLGFVQTYLYPILFFLVIPAISLFFLGMSQDEIDQEFLEAVESQINLDKQLTAEEKQDRVQFFRSHPVSSILADNDPRLDDLRAVIDDTTKWYCLSLQVGLLIAWWSIILGPSLLAICSLPLRLSAPYPKVHYYVMVAEWNLLKLFCFMQVIGQAYLVIALSFWITATFGKVYYLKLILIAFVISLIPAYQLILAIVANIDRPVRVRGRILPAERAPLLFARVGEYAAKIGSAVPDQVLLSMDDDFFVTNEAVESKDGAVAGRTLVLGLPMLRILDRNQADAIIVHELAHFCGDDLIYSTKIYPLLNQYASYLNFIYQNPICRPVFYFMRAFWSFFHQSIETYTLKREFKADEIAAAVVSTQDLAVGLVLLARHARFRLKLETEFFNQDKLQDSLDIPEKIRSGFWEEMRKSQRQTTPTPEVPHPYDWHPSYDARLRSLELPAAPSYATDFSEVQEEQTWIPQIEVARDWENAFWTEYQKEFQERHEASLAYRFLPESEEEAKMVEKQFPELVYSNKKGKHLTITATNVYFPDKDRTVAFAEMKELALENETFTHHIYIQYLDKKKKRDKFVISGFDVKHVEISNKLGAYLQRYQMAAEYVKKRKEAEGGQPPATGA